MVPEALGVHTAGLLQKQLHFLAGKNFGIPPLRLCGGQTPCGAGRHGAGRHHKAVKRLDGGQKPRHRCGGLALCMHPVHIALNHLGRGAAQLAALLHMEKRLKLGHIPQISGHRIDGGALLCGQIFFVKLQVVRRHSKSPPLPPPLRITLFGTVF
ncbi:hypothetical protein SDC9_103376 [bioreactor metagenome]|uniref:Uncharacterized protein n=1 Tax=bioreactor metagenome TaxID=1076179 RepID=A0A645ATZ6_9ZZZZ